MREFLTIAAAAAAILPGVAAAAEPPCLTPAEFTALSSYSLPSIIAGTAQRCAATLPANAWLKLNGARLALRYAEAKPAAWPSAKAAFVKLSGTTANGEAANLLKTMPDASLQQMLDGLISGMVGQQLPAERCGVVDRLVRLLAPLPPENTAELIAVAVGLGAKSGKARIGALSICPA